MDVSIIIPVFFNEESIREIFLQVSDVLLANINVKDYEIIFIDDGSEDNSFNEIIKLKEEFFDRNIKVIKFTRNFGQVSAIRAGYLYSTGKAVINISADLQDPPILINRMLDEYFNNNYEVVICARESREENFLRKLTSKIFYSLIRILSFKNIPKGGFDFLLVSNRVKNLILQNSESNPFLQGQILYLGFKPKFIYYKRLKRKKGKSRWTFSMKLKYLIDGILNYSYLPVRLMSLLGLIIALLGFLYAIIIIIAKIFGDIPFTGWAPIMITVLVLSGFQMLMLGIIGEYLWRTLDQVRNRPPFVIEKIIE